MITKEQYDQIQREYDQKQLDALYRHDCFMADLYERVPRLKEIKEETATLQVARIKKQLFPGSADERDYDAEISALTSEREQIYKENGITKDDLLPHFSCPDCKDTGYTSPGVHCHCFTQAVIDVLYSQSGIATLLNSNSFDQFDFSLFDDETVDEATGKTARANMAETVSYCHRFIDEFQTQKRNLLFYGETGVGKTFLTNCIAKALLEQSYSVLYLSAIDLSKILTDVAFHNRKADETVHFQADYIFDCDLLIIDDLGTEVTNSLKSSHLFNCLDKRLNAKKSTIISTNLSPMLINKQYSDRIFSRILGNYTCFKLFGADLRLKS